MTAGAEISAQPFNYLTISSQSIVVFDENGLPFLKANGSLGPLTSGAVEIALGGATRSVNLAPITGRVTVQ